MKPEAVRREIEACSQRLEMMGVISILQANSNFMRLIEHWNRYRSRVHDRLAQSRPDPYEQGLMQGQLHILNDLCQSDTDIAAAMSRLEDKRKGLQQQLKDQENRAFRAPPPLADRRPPPEMPQRVASFLPTGGPR